jgi:glycosyltransferase involved in cell wall biosynthesis
MLSKELLIVIPVYNEEKTISLVIDKAKKFGHVLVVNDCSTDNTFHKIESESVLIINNKENLGYEKSLHIGINFAVKHNYQYCITIDGDGQHKPKYIKTIYDGLKNGYEIVLTNRKSKNRFGERIVGLMARLIYGVNDPYSGLKGYKLNNVKLIKHNLNNTIGLYLSLKMLHNKNTFIEYPISIEERKFGKSTFDTQFFLINLFLIRTFLKTHYYVKSSSSKTLQSD